MEKIIIVGKPSTGRIASVLKYMGLTLEEVELITVDQAKNIGLGPEPIPIRPFPVFNEPVIIKDNSYTGKTISNRAQRRKAERDAKKSNRNKK